MPLAVVLAYADGFWLISLRGAVGSIERTREPFASWLRESTLALPVFVLAVLGALTLAARWFGPVLRKPKTVVAAALLVVAAGTLVGIAGLAASSAYDYHLQSSQLQRWTRHAHAQRPHGSVLDSNSRRRSRYRCAQWAMAAGYSWSPTSCSSAGWWRFGAADWASANRGSIDCAFLAKEDKWLTAHTSTASPQLCQVPKAARRSASPPAASGVMFERTTAVEHASSASKSSAIRN